MIESPLSQPELNPSPHPSWSDRVARRAFQLMLSRLREGELAVLDGSRRYRYGSMSPDFEVKANLRVNSPRFYSAFAKGSVGAGRSYMEGEWDSDDLAAVVRILTRNLGSLDGLARYTRWLTRPLLTLGALIKSNTPARNKEQIAHHYDLGNEFFELFLDPTMMYSCAVFENEDTTLHDAQIAKIERLCRKLELHPDDHLLEIGTGWGGFACHAAQNYGCKVTTTTISEEQFRRARDRIGEAGLGDRITVLKKDYRELKGHYDKLVSIEMIEAVGWQELDTFFATCNRLLRPSGVMALQAITIADQAFEDYKLKNEFIKEFIFPGGCVLSVTAMMNAVAKATDMRLTQLEDISSHYALTLNAWRQNLYTNLEAIEALGYDRRFLRMWELYLAGCEGSFRERRIGDVQMLLAKPRFRSERLFELGSGVAESVALSA